MIALLIYILISPLLWLCAIPPAFLLKKGRLRLYEEYALRRTAYKRLHELRGDQPVMLFHAASAGEFEQLKPLLHRVDREAIFAFQTFYSHTICSREKQSTLFDAFCYHPLDSIVSALLFFLHVRPCVYVINRHDLWPSHIFAAKLLGIRTVIINTNMHERSRRYLPIFRRLNRAMLEMTDLILCGSARIQNNIYKLAPRAKVQIVGETRFEQVILRARKNPRDHFSSNVLRRHNIVLGSIIPSDYEIVFGGIRSYWGKKSGHQKGQRIIAVPHEVGLSDIVRLEAVLDRFGFSRCRYSENRTDEDTDCLIVDRVGILADLYLYGWAAYVGAGFGAGVHSVIEPAVYGIPVFFGPYIHILDEAVAMKERGIGTVVTDVKSTAVFLGSLENRDRYESLCSATNSFVKEAGEASERIYEILTGMCRP